MRQTPPALQAHLDSGATTLCRCWKLTRSDGVALGFTDHDRALNFDGVVFEPNSGFVSTAAEIAIGLATDESMVEGALSSTSLNADGLAAGLYDNAGLEEYLVNWTDVAQRLLIRTGIIGEVARNTNGFTVEFRGLTDQLDQSAGRRYQHSCDVNLGDARCGVDLELSAFKGSGVVMSVNDRLSFTATGLGAFTNAWFDRGRIIWTSGANAGLVMEVKSHVSSGGEGAIQLWRPMARAIAIGDGFDVTAGCDKRFATCRDKFSNVLNFRGFHIMPGNDFLQIVPQPGENRRGDRLG